MAKTILRANAHVDILNADELRSVLAEAAREERAKKLEEDGEILIVSAPSFKTDASGNTAYLGDGAGLAFTCPAGFDVWLNRMSIDYEGSVSTSSQACDVRIVADAVTPAALRWIGTSIPNVADFSTSHAPLFRAGSRILVALQSGPVSKPIYCTSQVRLVARKPVRPDVLR